MEKKLINILIFLFVCGTAAARQKPNIIYILTDDLGYGDLGVFFQKQRQEMNSARLPFMLTPNLDRMAEGGATMEQYCAAPVCAPSRASLLLGVSQGHANVRDNQFDKALEDNYTLGNVLQKMGYRTGAIGKWGLQGNKTVGPHWPAGPRKRGFDYYYGYISHGDGKEHYPKEGLYRGAKKLWDNDQEISNQLDGCYTGDLFTAMAKKYIIDHQKKEKSGTPFFLYLAYDTPHAVLELPSMAYPEGGGLQGGIQWQGKPGKMINTAGGVPDSWTHPEYANRTYDHDNNASTPEEAWPDTYKRYATVVRRIDDQVGDLLTLLKDLRIDHNTLVVFSSDNGPSAESNLPKPFVGFTPNFFGGYGPFDGIKRDVLEGGVRVPTIVSWPSKIPAGIKIVEPSISYDWMPTFTALAGWPAPVRSDGISLAPMLTGSVGQKHRSIYIEYFNNTTRTPAYPGFEKIRQGRVRNQMQMLRFGDTVGIRYDIKSAQDDFEIFDIISDPKQAINLADKAGTAIQKRFKAAALQMRKADADAPRPYDNEPIPAAGPSTKVRGLNWALYARNYPWLANTDHLKASHTGTSDGLDVSKAKGEGQVCWSGYLDVPEDGYYTFYFSVEGRGFVRLHDIALLDADYNYVSGQEKQAKVNLKKGRHPVRIYYSTDGQAKRGLSFQWASDTIERQNIGGRYFLR